MHINYNFVIFTWVISSQFKREKSVVNKPSVGDFWYACKLI